MSAVQINALTEFETILRKALPGVELPSNLVELMLAAMKEVERDRLNDFSFAKPKIDAITKSTLKTVVKLLPFMPDRIDYMIDQGRCGAIEFDSGLFLPCCKACADGHKFCKGHVEKPSPFGDFAERCEKWNEGLGVGTLEFTVDDDTKTEITYGEYLLKKQITPEQVKQAIKEAGLCIRLHPHDLQVRTKAKKARGRPSEKKVQAVSLEGSDEPADETNDEANDEAKPKATRVKLTEEEKKEKAEREAAEKAEKKEKREAERKIIAERKAEEEIAKAKLQAEKAAAKAKEAAEKAEAKANGVKSKPKPKAKAASPKSSPPHIGTSLDATYYSGELDELTESEDPTTGTKFWLDEERNVYDASKKKVGTINDEGDLIPL